MKLRMTMMKRDNSAYEGSSTKVFQEEICLYCGDELVAVVNAADGGRLARAILRLVPKPSEHGARNHYAASLDEIERLRVALLGIREMAVNGKTQAWAVLLADLVDAALETSSTWPATSCRLSGR